MAKQSSYSLNERSLRTLESYGKYLEEVSKKIGLPTTKYSKNELLNGALALLDVCADKYNVFSVDKGIEIYN